MELPGTSEGSPPPLFFVFLALVVVNVAYSIYSARQGARHPVAIPFWREALPTDLANTIRMLALPASTEWQQWGRTYKTELLGAPGDMEVRVAVVDARRARTMAPYWAKIRSEGMEMRVTYSISPFILVGYAVFALFFVQYFPLAEFGYLKWLFGGFMLVVFLATPIQTRHTIRMGLRKFMETPVA